MAARSRPSQAHSVTQCSSYRYSFSSFAISDSGRRRCDRKTTHMPFDPQNRHFHADPLESRALWDNTQGVDDGSC
ncbi:hypothetical protein PM082_015629 [Marasmius tenuissimus]|nr:hypothetical protein PM082_015629 [Marasmius tenuissimus]